MEWVLDDRSVIGVPFTVGGVIVTALAATHISKISLLPEWTTAVVVAVARLENPNVEDASNEIAACALGTKTANIITRAAGKMKYFLAVILLRGINSKRDTGARSHSPVPLLRRSVVR